MIFKNEYLRLLAIHVGIGFSVYLFSSLSKLYFIIISIYLTYDIFAAKLSEKHVKVLMACSYIVGSEVFLRMTQGYFFYETSKYLVIFYCVLGFFYSGISQKSLPFVLYLMLLMPGIYLGLMNANYDSNIKKNIFFNLSGPVTLGIASLFCYRKIITLNQINKVLMYAVLPLVSTTVYLFLFTPDLRDVITGTGSNFSTSGGFGPNQVATMLGFGIFILSSRFFLSSNNTILLAVNGLLLVAMSFRAIVTFSRGGVITSVAMIIAFVFIYFKVSNKKNRKRILRYTYIFLAVIALTWVVSSIQTMGYIDKRYSNKDAAGREKADVTTGRADLVTFELNEFMKNPFLGIGVGKVKEARLEYEGVAAASHNELSRIVSEHGILGAIAFMILFFLPLIYRISNRKNIYFYSFFIFWFLTINHSSMRLAAPAFVYALSLLNVINEKPPVHRKQAISKK